MVAELPRIESASFRYSSAIMPSPYLSRLGWTSNDAGINPFANSGIPHSRYSLHDNFTIGKGKFDASWAAVVAVFAPEQAVSKYGSMRYLHLPLKDIQRDTKLQGFSLEFEQMPG
ncbi:MAG: hypothetical protein UU24_C0026G0006, partial [Candidatus Nomurabacteria bacterium GW2011_GWA2_40_9]